MLFFSRKKIVRVGEKEIDDFFSSNCVRLASEYNVDFYAEIAFYTREQKWNESELKACHLVHIENANDVANCICWKEKILSNKLDCDKNI